MLARTVILLSFLSFVGAHGCAPLGVMPLRGGKTEEQKPGPVAVARPPEVEVTPADGASTDTLPELRDTEKLGPSGSRSLADRSEPNKITGELHVDFGPPAPKRGVVSAPAMQKTRGPRTDDQLLDLVEQDLGRTLDQPVQRHRLQFSKAVVEHPRVRHFINYYAKSKRQFFENVLSRSGKYFPMIAAVLRDEGLPEALAYLALIESEFSPHAVSPSGAAGLWQFIPSTARKYGLRVDKWVDERRDPVKSTRAAAAYLKNLHEVFGRWYLAMAAYNAGQGAIFRAMERSGAKDFWSLSRKAKLREETRNFVPKFVAASMIAADPKKYGFTYVIYETPLEYEVVKVRRNLSLASLAAMAGTDARVIRDLNPELLRNRVPPGEPDFELKLPLGHRDIFVEASLLQRNTHGARWVTHEVRKGDTLFAIARRYGQQVRTLMELNGLASSRLQIGQKLKVLLNGLRGGLR